MTKEDLKGKAAKAVENVAETARSAGREAIDATKAAASDVAAEVGQQAKQEAHQRAEMGKDLLADQGQRLASGLRDAAADHGSGTVQNRLLDTVANSVSDVSEGLRHRTVGSILNDVESFARRNPGAFVAGAAIAGFALARFARASSPSEPLSNADFAGHSTAAGSQTDYVATRTTSGLPTQNTQPPQTARSQS